MVKNIDLHVLKRVLVRLQAQNCKLNKIYIVQKNIANKMQNTLFLAVNIIVV